MNMKLLGNWNPLNPSENPNTSPYNDVWGYAADGREYAIVGGRDSVFFVDITDPRNPEQVGSFFGTGVTSWRDMKTYSHYAFAGSERNGEGLMVFDLQHLPDSVVQIDRTTEFFTRSHNIFIDTSSAWLYALGAREGSTYRDIIILDISDPYNLVEVNEQALPGGYIHDAYIRNDTMWASHGSFNTDFNEYLVYDCSSGSCNLINGIYNYPQEGYQHSSWVHPEKNIVVWADESHDRSMKIAEYNARMQFTVTDLFRSKLLEPITGDTGSIAHNPFIKGDSVYVSYYHDGLVVFDISDPTDVKLAGYYDTHPENTNYSSYKGVWGAYPYLPSGVVLASDRHRGLHILQMVEETTLDDYTESTEDFVNPERGWYRYSEARSSGYQLLDSTTLADQRELHQPFSADYSVYSSLVFRYFFLEDFKTGPISQGFLDSMQMDFDIARSAGAKIIMRMAYTDQTTDCGGEYCRPYGDASKSVVLDHIDQIEPLLEANSDVIMSVQMGFIGIWGENYYTDHFGDASQPPYYLTSTHWQDRIDVLKALLDAVPEERMIQVRYPQMKQKYVHGTAAMTDAPNMDPSSAFGGSHEARIGVHNDCFLSDAGDIGTYTDYSDINGASMDTTNLKPYLAEESKYTLVGGETCSPYLPTSDCASNGGIAETEMARFHWTYLNADYNNALNNDWNTHGCIDDISKSLGYRFVLRETTVQNSARPGGSIDISLTIDNVGFASLVNPRSAEIVLRDTITGDIWKAQLDIDPRSWMPGETSFTAEICASACMPEADYEVLLHLADPATTLYEDPRYSIRLANQGLWEATTGYNKLKQHITISAGGGPQSCATDDYLNSTTRRNEWVGPAIANWDASPSHWSLGRLPEPCDFVIIPAGHEVTIPTGLTVYGSTLQVDAGAELIGQANTIANIFYLD